MSTSARTMSGTQSVFNKLTMQGSAPRTIAACAALVSLAVLAGGLGPAPLAAQQGHPMVGTWHGEYWEQGNADHRSLTLVVYFDGKQITGLMNPGLDSSDLRNATLDPVNGWHLHLEGDVTEPSGDRHPMILDGAIHDLTSVQRRIEGTWTGGGLRGSFELTRDD